MTDTIHPDKDVRGPIARLGVSGSTYERMETLGLDRQGVEELLEATGGEVPSIVGHPGTVAAKAEGGIDADSITQAEEGPASS